MRGGGAGREEILLPDRRDDCVVLSKDMLPQEENVFTEEDVMRHVEEQKCLRRETDRSFVYKCIAWLLIILFVCAVVSGINFTPRRPGRSEMMRSISNSKQVYLALMDFEADFGYFPDDASAASKPELNHFRGSHSNDYLGQLIADGYISHEDTFYAKDLRYPQKPDDVIAPSSRILEKNECGFSYVMVEDNGKIRGLNTKDNVGIPILVAPLVNQWGSCEESSYDNRGVYLRVDGSARSDRLRSSDQRIQIGGGMTLFDTGSGTVWGKLKPVLLLPER